MIKDPLNTLVFERLDDSLAHWVDRVNELGLWMLVSPDGREIAIFNDRHLGRGYLQVRACGAIGAAWSDNSWQDIDVDTVPEVLDYLTNG